MDKIQFSNLPKNSVVQMHDNLADIFYTHTKRLPIGDYNYFLESIGGNRVRLTTVNNGSDYGFYATVHEHPMGKYDVYHFYVKEVIKTIRDLG